MTIIGLSIPEVAALLSILSLLIAAISRFYHKFKTTISAPLIEAMDKLRHEINQLEGYLVTEYETLNNKTEKLAERLRRQECQLEQKGEMTYDDCRLVDKG
ncbi:hypothetical protein I6N95_17585 [Vagococcus sp. BWB3-3]|uniref:Uncharacterized protein n=1 Tax=Vagococcus allomyrinae TaxID=2794353 RepID=A0A940P7I6_9ENTE|nr:hypothetical protein [Vagococcus allomyrinae]MBP1042832.1 hypothetical protein [Vagococcus allomyrinae]